MDNFNIYERVIMTRQMNLTDDQDRGRLQTQVPDHLQDIITRTNERSSQNVVRWMHKWHSDGLSMIIVYLGCVWCILINDICM
jgi:hypothetical protein